MRVLVADDDPFFQSLLKTSLALWGYETIAVSDGAAAWQVLNSPTGPRLAVLDCVMPHADGLELCRRVRAAGLPHYLYIILLTAKGKPADVAAGLEAGADDYLSKPVNLTELKLRLRAACRVLQAEERHRVIAESASDGIVTFGADNCVQYANPVAASIFGCERRELAGADFGCLVPDYPRYCLETMNPDGGARESERSRSWGPIEMAGRHRSGRQLILDISFSESGPAYPNLFTTAVIRDVTCRRAEERKQAQAKKLESIGQLAAGIAHEINTPIQYTSDNLRFVEQSLTTLRQFLHAYERLLAACKNGAPTAPVVGEIEELARVSNYAYMRQETPAAIVDALEGVQRVAEIVRALNEFSHPGNIDRAPTDLNRVIDVTVLVSRNRWKDVADLYRDMDPHLPMVTCVAGEVSQVFLNLIVNAADAVAEALNGSEARKGAIWISSRHDGAFVEIRVRDSGTGIPAAVRPRIFDPFFTTKDVGRGSGQGLAIAHAIIVERHHGTIEFETEVGKGTTFVVRLPIEETAKLDVPENLDEGRSDSAPELPGIVMEMVTSDAAVQ